MGTENMLLSFALGSSNKNLQRYSFNECSEIHICAMRPSSSKNSLSSSVGSVLFLNLYIVIVAPFHPTTFLLYHTKRVWQANSISLFIFLAALKCRGHLVHDLVEINLMMRICIPPAPTRTRNTTHYRSR